MGDVIVVSQYNINLNILYDLTYFLKSALKEKQNTKYQSWYVRTLWVMDSFVFWVGFFFHVKMFLQFPGFLVQTHITFAVR